MKTFKLWRREKDGSESVYPISIKAESFSVQDGGTLVFWTHLGTRCAGAFAPDTWSRMEEVGA